jgi:low affinity Fe/Cu permease
MTSNAKRSASASLERFSEAVTRRSGSTPAFLAAVGVVGVWGALGPIFDYSDTWQLVINTGTTIVTFLMVFLIQSTQNRDSEAVQVKLDEIIRAIGNAKNEVLDLEELEEEELDEIRQTYTDMAEKAREGRSKESAARRAASKTSKPARRRE